MPLYLKALGAEKKFPFPKVTGEEVYITHILEKILRKEENYGLENKKNLMN